MWLRSAMFGSLCFIVVSLPLHAQATRTWVSGVGDDANPCSRTAPCKTFAGAISKTAAKGEINPIDPGGYGSVTITKSITIDGGDELSGVLAANTSGIVINAASTDKVVLRHLDINGSGTGLYGIRILNAANVIIQDCRIYGFTTRGISIDNSAGSVRVAIVDTTIHNNTNHAIAALPGSTASVTLTLDHVIANDNTWALDVWRNTSATVKNCTFTNNTGGVFAESTSAEVDIYDSVLSLNTTAIRVGNGGGAPAVRIYGSQITQNSTAFSLTGGAVYSHGNNAIQGNGGGETPTSVIGVQ